MKKFFSNKLALSLSLALSFVACEDVPAPYELNLEIGSQTEQKVSSRENPFTVQDAIKDLNAGKNGNYWVKGFIVGSIPTSSDGTSTTLANTEFGVSNPNASNLVLAPTADETSTDNCMAIQLSSGTEVRTALNLVDHKENLGKEVLLYGSLEKYFTGPGLKSVSYCEIDGKSYGKDPDQKEDLGDPKGKGTADDPFNIAAAIVKCKETGETATADKYYVKGIVKSVDATDVDKYKNITVDLVDEPSSSNVFKAYRIKYYNGGDFNSQNASEVKVGDTIVVLGNLVNYKNNTPETTASSVLVSVNGSSNIPTPSLEAGNGTLASPYNTARALALIKAGTITSDSVYVSGRVVASPALQFDDVNGVATYTLAINNIDTTKFTIKNGLMLGGKKFNDEEDVMPGDTVIVYGVLSATDGLSGSRIVSLNGEVAGIYTPPTPKPTGDNLLANGDFETWTDDKTPENWKPTSSAGGATLARSEDAHTGSYSVQMVKNSQNKRLAYKELDLTAGTYVMTFFAKSMGNATSNYGPQVKPGYVPVTDGKVGSYAYSSSYFTVATEWTEITYEFTLSADATICPLVMNPANGGDMLIDDFSLIKK